VFLNNRELAVLFWLGVLLVWMLSRRDTRSSLGPLVRSFFKAAILVPLLAFALYLAGAVLLARYWGLWQDDLLNDTVAWFLAVGFVMFFNIERVYTSGDFFKNTALNTIKAGVAIEVFVNLVVLPLLAELILVPVLTFLAMTLVVAESKKEYEPSRRLLSGILAVFGLAIFAFVGISLITNPGQLGLTYLLEAFALPIWLTVASLPFIYLVGLYAGYQRIFLRLDLRDADPNARRRAKLALVLACHLRATSIGDVSWRKQHELLEASSLAEARRTMRGGEEVQLEVVEADLDDTRADEAA